MSRTVKLLAGTERIKNKNRENIKVIQRNTRTGH